MKEKIKNWLKNNWFNSFSYIENYESMPIIEKH